MLLSSTVITNRWLAFLLVSGLLVLLWTLSPTTNWFKPHSEPIWGSTASEVSKTDTAALPPDYAPAGPASIECAKRYGTLFLESTSNASAQYCSEDSRSRLTCFRSHLDDKTNSFCLGSPAEFDHSTKKFNLGCDLRNLTEDEVAAGVPELSVFPTSYWYETGTKLILDRHVDLHAEVKSIALNAKSPRNFTVLVRREQPVDNLWHHFMQLSAVFFTLDVFQMASDPATGRALFQTEDIANAQVVIFDNHPDGPFYDQWTAFAGRGVVRAKDLPTSSTPTPESIIVPLTGAANPLWKGDWEPGTCEGSSLLRVFAQRMAHFYSVPDSPPLPPDRPLVLTFISRKEKRSLIDKDSYIRALKTRYPRLEISLVDFASLTFAEQIATVRRTDILAGVHGAGLAHSMFLPPDSALAEIMPVDFHHKGFRNLAKRLGHRYFTTHATAHENYTTSKGWQYDDVWIEQARFEALIDAAVKSMYHRGLLDMDVN